MEIGIATSDAVGPCSGSGFGGRPSAWVVIEAVHGSAGPMGGGVDHPGPDFRVWHEDRVLCHVHVHEVVRARLPTAFGALPSAILTRMHILRKLEANPGLQFVRLYLIQLHL